MQIIFSKGIQEKKELTSLHICQREAISEQFFLSFFYCKSWARLQTSEKGCAGKKKWRNSRY